MTHLKFIKLASPFALLCHLLICISTQCAGSTPAEYTLTEKSIQRVDGKSVPIQNILHPRSLTIVVFIMHDCPISNRLLPEVKRIFSEQKGQTQCFVAYVEPESDKSSVIKHSTEYETKSWALRDTHLDLARSLGAKVTPECFVIAPDGKVIYRGRVNDLYVDFGKRRVEPTKHDLRDSINNARHGNSKQSTTIKPIGCYITYGSRDVPTPNSAKTSGDVKRK